MYYIFLFIAFFSFSADTFSMDKKYSFFNMKCEELHRKNNAKKPFFLKDLSLLLLSPKTINNSAILTRMIEDKTNSTSTLPFNKQDLPHIQSILQNKINAISTENLERCFEIALYLDVHNNILYPLAERYACSWGTKNKKLMEKAKKCGSLAQLTYDELADHVIITNDPLTYEIQCSIDLENKNLYSLHGFEKFFELIEHKNLITKVCFKSNELTFLNTQLLSKLPNLSLLDISENQLSSLEQYKLHVKLFRPNNAIRRLMYLVYSCALAAGSFYTFLSVKKFGSSTDYSAPFICLAETGGIWTIIKYISKITAMIPRTKELKIITTPQKKPKNKK